MLIPFFLVSFAFRALSHAAVWGTLTAVFVKHTVRWPSRFLSTYEDVCQCQNAQTLGGPRWEEENGQMLS